MFTAIGIALATLFLTPLLYFLPKATLAATIIVAVLSLVDFKSLGRAWRYSKSDFLAQAGTITLTLLVGVEAGIIAGVAIGIVLVLYRMSAPHAAVVGLVPGTQHYRNILRHHVITSPHVWSLRIDENLVFANARRLEELVLGAVAENKNITEVVLMCPAVSFVDFSALEALEELNHRLEDAGVRLHLSEVKGPVMDRLQRSEFLHELTGEIFLSHHEAMLALDPERFGKEA
jgi:Sulfate permease and related transporters (MFS superfamily)